jgi:hypothetical protein
MSLQHVVDARLPGWHLRARMLAALPEFASALYLAWLWMWPATMGRDGVLTATLVVALELPLLAILFGVRGFLAGSRPGQSFKSRYEGRILAGACIVFACYMGWHTLTELWGMAATDWMALTIVAVFAGKAMQFHADRHRMAMLDLLATGGAVLLFAFCFLMAQGAPDLGFTADALAAMDLPIYAPGAPELWHVPWSQGAGAAVAYFSIVGAFRFLFAAPVISID